MRSNERTVFERFLRLVPNFAGRSIQWGDGTDPPDVLCTSGNERIGVELGEWLDEWQIAYQKGQEREDDSYSQILVRAKSVSLSHLTEVWMVPCRRLDPANAVTFEREFFTFIRERDVSWPTRLDHDDPQGIDVESDEFLAYQSLGRHLAGLECYGTVRPAPASDWLNMFVGGAAAYDPDDAVQALVKVFEKKCAMYGTLRADQQLDELYLILYYDQGWQYNTPYQAPGSGFSDVANTLRVAASQSHGQFDRIFLFDSVTSLAASVWP